jgi:1,4-dihydroxy-2-naphthoyl-CoA hydrolase
MDASKYNQEFFNKLSQGTLPAHLGIRIVSVAEGELHAEMAIAAHHLAPNGYLHAGSVVTLADTACGFGCIANLPEGANNFTTVELKSNHLGTAREGAIAVVARMVHAGRTTQVWDAVVTNQANGKTIALFRCTQMILYPKG